MAGAGYKLFATGDVLTAAQVNTYLMQQTVMVFASSAARTTALSGVLAEGMVSYLQDTNSLEVYDGSAWVGATGDITALTAGTGITITSNTGPIPTVAINTAVTADLTTAQTMTNKTLTAPVISTISNSGTLTLPTGAQTIVGTTATQTLTNKTLTSPVISTISNTGTLTLPTSTDTIVGRATTDTLTNKTLTSPVLTTPSISNINAKGDLLPGTADNTIGTLTVGANGTVLTADSAEATGMKWATPSGGGTYTDYTPTFANFTIGNGTINFARYVQIGKFVSVYGKVTLGSTSSMGTSPTISLPVTGTSNMSGVGWALGSLTIGDTGTGSFEGYVKTSSTTVAQLIVGNASGTYNNTTVITSAVPMTWANTDTFLFNFTYEAA